MRGNRLLEERREGLCSNSGPRTQTNVVDGDDVGHSGDKSSAQSYVSFGANVHAVADGTVVAVNRGQPEQIPTVWPPALQLNDYGGNYVVQDIGNGRYAFYAHLQDDSVKVSVGDHLRAGQVIGLLGNSGNSSAPHLHFYIIDGPDLLASNGLPFEIDSFRLDARISPDANLDQIADGAKADYAPNIDADLRKQQMPLTLDVMAYQTGN